jgi:hypothetical protein
MRSDFKPSPASPPTREEELRFVMVKDVRVMTGALRRVDEERWEAVYEADGTLYMSETLASCELAERHLANTETCSRLPDGQKPNTSRFIPIASVERSSPARSRASIESRITSRPCSVQSL